MPAARSTSSTRDVTPQLAVAVERALALDPRDRYAERRGAARARWSTAPAASGRAYADAATDAPRGARRPTRHAASSGRGAAAPRGVARAAGQPRQRPPAARAARRRPRRAPAAGAARAAPRRAARAARRRGAPASLGDAARCSSLLARRRRVAAVVATSTTRRTRSSCAEVVYDDVNAGGRRSCKQLVDDNTR